VPSSFCVVIVTVASLERSLKVSVAVAVAGVVPSVMIPKADVTTAPGFICASQLPDPESYVNTYPFVKPVVSTSFKSLISTAPNPISISSVPSKATVILASAAFNDLNSISDAFFCL